MSCVHIHILDRKLQVQRASVIFNFYTFKNCDVISYCSLEQLLQFHPPFCVKTYDPLFTKGKHVDDVYFIAISVAFATKIIVFALGFSFIALIFF
jgi:hypothetical protein